MGNLAYLFILLLIILWFLWGDTPPKNKLKDQNNDNDGDEYIVGDVVNNDDILI